MKGLIKFISAILTIVTAILEFLEYLVIPAMLIFCGLLNRFSWQYYVISIGICIVFYALIEVTAYFVFKAIDKKYSSRIEKKIEKILDRFSKKG